MADLVQWSIDQLFAALDQIRAGAEGERVTISENNQRLIDLNAAADQLADPAARAQLKSSIAGAVDRQYQIAGTWRELSKRFSDMAAQIKAWLESIGIQQSVPGLSGLAGPELIVPIAIIGLAAAAWAAVAWIHQANQPQLARVGYLQQSLAALQAANATPDEIAQFVAQSEAQLKTQEPPGDPFGIQHIIGGLTNLLIVGTIALVALKALPAITRRRSAA